MPRVSAIKAKVKGSAPAPAAGNPARAAAAAQKKAEADAKKAAKEAERDQKKRDREQAKIDKEKLKAQKALEKSNKALSVATGVILAKAINKMVSNSKILSTVFSTLNKLFGLLIDIVLLPFLPLIMGGLLYLAEAIMGFSDWWQKNVPTVPGVTTEPTEGQGAGKKLSEETLGTFLGIDIPTAAAMLAGALLGAVVAALIMVAAGAAVVSAGWVIAAAILGAILTYILVQWAYELGVKLGPVVGKWFNDLGIWINDTVAAFEGWKTSVAGIFSKMFEDVKSIFVVTWNSLMDMLGPLGKGFKTSGTGLAGDGAPSTSTSTQTNTNNNNNIVNIIGSTGLDMWNNISKAAQEIW